MLQVNKDLCLGCGLCAGNCPQQAITIRAGQAEINGSRCRECRICVEVCPQGAIVERVPLSSHDMLTTVESLKQKTDDLIKRIEKLKQPRPDLKNFTASNN